MPRKLIQIDDLTDECGFSFSYNDPNINNGYNCNNPSCDDFEYVKNNEIVDLNDEIRKYVINKITNRKRRLREKIIKKYWTNRNGSECFWIKKLNIKKIGKCFTFSCPIAHSADLEDMQNLDKYLYEEYKNEEFFESEWMVYDTDYRPEE